MKEQLLHRAMRILTVNQRGGDAYFLKNITKSYGDTYVLEKETIVLPRNGILLLTGASGAGKTTLFNLIAGIVRPDAGVLEGFADAKIAYLFQEDRLLPWKTVKQNLLLAAEADRTEQWLQITQLTGAADKYPRELSGGMKRRAALARAMAYGGDIYLLDEPFNGIDAQLKMKILGKIVEAAEDSLLILSTHEADIISQLTKTDETLYHETMNEHIGRKRTL